MTENASSVALLISSFTCEPKNISDALRLEPTEVIREGDQLGKGPRRSPINVWRLDSPLDEPVILERHVTWLLDQLPTDFERRMNDTAPGWDAQIAIASHVSTSQAPQIGLALETVQRMAAHRLSLDVDIYCMG